MGLKIVVEEIDKEADALNIPEGVTDIGVCAGNRGRMFTISFPKSLERIRPSAFGLCPNLKSVIIPENVVQIHPGAFAYCTNLQQVVIPSAWTNISDEVFKGCKNLTIYAPVGSKAEEYAKEHKIKFVEL